VFSISFSSFQEWFDFFANTFLNNFEGLLDERGVEVLIELACTPELSDLNSTVFTVSRVNKIRLSNLILKMKLYLRQKAFLISFYGEMVVGGALLDKASNV